MKVGEIIRKLKKQGWHIQDHGAEHDLWSHELLKSRPCIAVPRHKSEELSNGVEHDILKGMREVEKNRKGIVQ